MLVYRKQERSACAAEVLSQLHETVQHYLKRGIAGHEDAVALFLEYGAFESAVVDAIFPERDGNNETVRALRRAAILTGHLLYHSWRLWQKRANGAGPVLQAIGAALEVIGGHALPGSIHIRIPEGYVHYGLYPETYCRAANFFLDEVKPEHIVCIGLRSIGTSLSAAVAAVLEYHACRVTSYTVRPRGHPFYRSVQLEREFEDQIRERAHSHFIIVDEGPGLSGSSFCSMAEKLSAIGIPDDKIIFFPSWEPDGSAFISETAARRWTRHRKYIASFDTLWLDSGRLFDTRTFRPLHNISVGRWRTLLYQDGLAAPAVHPNHERRKYLTAYSRRQAVCPGGHALLSIGEGERVLIKFAGLGRYGVSKFERAARLSTAGFTSPVYGLSNGFIIERFTQGTPLTAGEADEEVLLSIVRYCVFLRENFGVAQGTRYEELHRMAKRNVTLGLGESWAAALDGIGLSELLLGESKAVVLDGRMFPHEWIRTDGGYIKTDAVDHAMDQFFPGCQDIAWDLAGTIIEFELGREKQDFLLSTYQKHARDHTIRRRMPFYLIAYLAFRLGYATFAAKELGSSPDGQKFSALVSRYTDLLKRYIAAV